MLEKLTEMIQFHTGDDSMVIKEDMVLKSDLGLNSLDLVNLVCMIEDEYKIEIPDRDITTFRTVRDVMDYLALIVRS